MKILAYQEALACVQKVVSQRQWDDLEDKTQQLNMAKDALKHALSLDDIDSDVKHRLEQLSIKHRRVMRQLSEQMQQTEDDLKQVNEGLRHIHRSQEFILNH